MAIVHDSPVLDLIFEGHLSEAIEFTVESLILTESRQSRKLTRGSHYLLDDYTKNLFQVIEHILSCSWKQS